MRRGGSAPRWARRPRACGGCSGATVKSSRRRRSSSKAIRRLPSIITAFSVPRSIRRCSAFTLSPVARAESRIVSIGSGAIAAHRRARPREVKSDTLVSGRSGYLKSGSAKRGGVPATGVAARVPRVQPRDCPDRVRVFRLARLCVTVCDWATRRGNCVCPAGRDAATPEGVAAPAVTSLRLRRPCRDSYAQRLIRTTNGECCRADPFDVGRTVPPRFGVAAGTRFRAVSVGIAGVVLPGRLRARRVSS